MTFVKNSKGEWLKQDRDKKRLYNFNDGYLYAEDIQVFDTIECKDWRELYLKKNWCPLEANIRWPNVWISPEGLFYNGDAHENRAEEILEIMYGEPDCLWPGDRLEELGWIRAEANLMWEVRMDSDYWKNKNLTQKQYDALWDWCKHHGKRFPQGIEVR